MFGLSRRSRGREARNALSTAILDGVRGPAYNPRHRNLPPIEEARGALPIVEEAIVGHTSAVSVAVASEPPFPRGSGAS